MESGSLKTKFWFNTKILAALWIGVWLPVAGAADPTRAILPVRPAAVQPAAPPAVAPATTPVPPPAAPAASGTGVAVSSIEAKIGEGQEAPLNFNIGLGAVASTARGVGPVLFFDGIFENTYTNGFYEGGFLPHIEISAQAFSGVTPLCMFSLGAEFFSNLNTANGFGLRNALMHGYREVFRSGPVFAEGNFLGLIPYYVSGFLWRVPFGSVALQWIPIEFVRSNRGDFMSFAHSGVQGELKAHLGGGRHDLGVRLRAGVLYLGFDGFQTIQPGAGVLYGVESQYAVRFQKFQVGTRLGIEGGFAQGKNTVSGAVTPWSSFGFQSMLFVLRQF